MSMSPPPPPPPPSSPPPPPPPPPSFGAPMPGGSGGNLGVGEILSRGWAAFMARIKDFVIVAIAVGVVNGLLAVVLRGDGASNGAIALAGIISLRRGG